MAHAAGCPTVDASGFAKFIEDYPWVLGTIFILCGPIIGMLGKRWFPWVISSLVAVMGLCGLLIVFTVFGWMETTLGFWICLVVAILLAGLLFWLAKRAIWLEVGLLGCLAGWFLGELLYSFIMAATGFEAMWFFIVLEIICVILCGIASWKFAKVVVIVATSGIGSFLFIRGWSYFFGGWPTTQEMMATAGLNNDEVDDGMATAYWVYFGLTLATWLFFVIWQVKKEHGKDHQELDDFYARH